MTSTFFGLETAKRGLTTQQTALSTVGHNIANANTPGYTRQRVNFATTNPYPAPAINRPQIPGQLGTGVKAGDIQRVRDSFTDMQYRTETSKLGYWQAKAEMIGQMEAIMNEPSDSGLSSVMDQFWNALQDLAVQPQNDGARRVVRERGISLATTFNYLSNSLKAIQVDYRKEIDTSQDKINSLLRQINAVNKQIGSVEPHGYLPNDLYDERDRLIDELSTMVNIRVDARPSGGNASAVAEGLLDVYLATPQGEILKDSKGRAIKLVDSELGTATGIHIQYENRSSLDSPVELIKFFQLNDTKPGFKGLENNIEADDSQSPSYSLDNLEALNSNGALKGYIEGYGYLDKNGYVKGTYNEMLADLDQMAFTFATHFNLVHDTGWSLDEIRTGMQTNLYGDFFDVGTTIAGAASRLKVADHIIKDINHIAAAAEGNVLAGVMTRDNVNPSTIGNPFYKGIYDPNDDALLTITGGDWPLTAKDVTLTVSSTVDDNFSPPVVTWKAEFKALDNDNNLITAEYTLTGGQKSVNLFGINLDVSNLSNPHNDTWTFTFNAQGEKKIDDAFAGDGSNALALANVKDAIINFGGNLTNVQSFYQGMIGKLGDNAAEANRMEMTASTLKNSVEERRMSESSVSLDEEMVNMIKFQHAYNAAARNITLIDEMLDKIINGMGVVGR